MIYLDYGATSPVRPEVYDYMLPFFRTEYGNPGSIHDHGQSSTEAIAHARAQIAQSLEATSAREIIFTSSGTESNNLALFGIARKFRHRGNHIITSAIEHPSILETCEALAQEGFEITYLPVNDVGEIDLSQLKEAVTNQTILVSIMAANNEVGTLQPIAEIGAWLRDQPIFFHTDAIQMFGKLPFSVQKLGVDLASIAAHKIGGPKGIGALYLRKGVRITPILYGGGQERDIRPSTQNTPSIAGFGLAASLATSRMETEQTRIASLRDLCWHLIQTRIPDVHLNGHPRNRLPNNLNLSFDRVEGQAILIELNREKIYVSSGSACSAGKHRASHVLRAMGRSEEIAHQSLRVTLGMDTKESDIYFFVDQLSDILQYLRRSSI
ncbi:cysteine desulfurase [Hazenella sp. IB182357]|uniref:cysteine desulfurase n=1 Tax=Polycladospora coralii TaxID=2771432 RepID=A0A926N6K9_9BACL|nr:cysteine desulfurase family protein [Polycladospora coralii]MBD1373159.1 cysteine desulfurase [Polycladospora coralii]MBS7531716.1 cysteine desulfurase [Polycladospora coralii]